MDSGTYWQHWQWIDGQFSKSGGSLSSKHKLWFNACFLCQKTCVSEEHKYLNQKWISSETGSKTQKYFPTVYHRLQAKKFFRSSYYMTQFITNHGKFNAYLTRFKLKDQSICDNCKITENAQHIIYDCIKFNDQREQLICNLIANGTQWPCNLSALISDIFINLSNIVILFLQAIKRQIFIFTIIISLILLFIL